MALRLTVCRNTMLLYCLETDRILMATHTEPADCLRFVESLLQEQPAGEPLALVLTYLPPSGGSS